MSVETVARRYAIALADVVTKTGDAASIQSELKTWETMMDSNVALHEVFGNPSIAHKSQEKVLETLIENHMAIALILSGIILLWYCAKALRTPGKPNWNKAIVSAAFWPFSIITNWLAERKPHN